MLAGGDRGTEVAFFGRIISDFWDGSSTIITEELANINHCIVGMPFLFYK